MTIHLLTRISRPRFWLYEVGTFAIGVCAALPFGSEVSLALIAVYAVYFLFPANLLIYGINDVYDYETDIRNPKKTGYEDVLAPALHRPVLLAVAATSALFVAYAFFLPLPALVAFMAFVFFAVFYSAPPIRAKARPVFDSVFSAGHYVATGVFGYYLAGGTADVWLPIAGGMLWAMAMHAYSAVPDITADAEAGLRTIATLLGGRATIVLCAVAYAFSGVVGALYLGISPLLLAVPYLYMMWRSYTASPEQLLRLYAYFPYLNAVTGMLVTLLILFGPGGLRV